MTLERLLETDFLANILSKRYILYVTNPYYIMYAYPPQHIVPHIAVQPKHTRRGVPKRKEKGEKEEKRGKKVLTIGGMRW